MMTFHSFLVLIARRILVRHTTNGLFVHSIFPKPVELCIIKVEYYIFVSKINKQ